MPELGATVPVVQASVDSLYVPPPTPPIRASVLGAHQDPQGRPLLPRVGIPWGEGQGSWCWLALTPSFGQVDHMTRHLEESERAMQERVQRLEALRLSLEEVRPHGPWVGYSEVFVASGP